MIKKSMKKLMALAMISTSILIYNPIGANAEWRQSANRQWWYAEGNSWATGWRQIDGNWYYFRPQDGYMSILTTIGKYYVNENGAWVDDSSFNITASKAEQLVRQKYYPGTSETEPYVKCCDFDGSRWKVHVAHETEFMTYTYGWYYVDKNTGNISSIL